MKLRAIFAAHPLQFISISGFLDAGAHKLITINNLQMIKVVLLDYYSRIFCCCRSFSPKVRRLAVVFQATFPDDSTPDYRRSYAAAGSADGANQTER